MRRSLFYTMKIKILGTRGKIEESAPGHVNHSGVLIDNKILIDVGEKSFLDHKPKLILFTHLHPDHAWFIETKEVFNYKAPVYTPEMNPLLKDAIEINEPLNWNGYQISPIPTIHSLKFKSQGYIIEHKGKRIFYSGDMVWIEKKFLENQPSFDAVITEASTIRKGGMVRNQGGKIFGHNGIPDLIKYFKSKTDKIIFLHFGSWFMKNAGEAVKKILALTPEGIQLNIAEDGSEYVI